MAITIVIKISKMLTKDPQKIQNMQQTGKIPWKFSAHVS